MRPTLVVLLLLAISCGESNKSTSLNYVIAPEPTASKDRIEKFYARINNPDNMDPLTGSVHVEIKKNSGSASVKNSENPYPSGNFYILWGIGSKDKDKNMIVNEYQELWKIMEYVNRLKFKVMVNFRAESMHLRHAIEDDDTTAILWSSHGHKEYLMDYNYERIPYNIFQNPGKNLRQLIVSACFGRIALDNHYNVPAQIKTWAWTEETYSSELMSFLLSEKWSLYDGMDTKTTIGGLQCIQDIKGYRVFNVETRTTISQSHFSELKDCHMRLTYTRFNTLCLLDENSDYYLYSSKTNDKIHGGKFLSYEGCKKWQNSIYENFVCIANDSNTPKIASTLTGEFIKAAGFKTFEGCQSFIRHALNNKICGFNSSGEGYVVVDASDPTNLLTPIPFDDLETCRNSLR